MCFAFIFYFLFYNLMFNSHWSKIKMNSSGGLSEPIQCIHVLSNASHDIESNFRKISVVFWTCQTSYLIVANQSLFFLNTGQIFVHIRPKFIVIAFFFRKMAFSFCCYKFFGKKFVIMVHNCPLLQFSQINQKSYWKKLLKKRILIHLLFWILGAATPFSCLIR